jgi:predicted restriction endonuclease
MKSLQYCHSKNIPIGVIYKKKKAHNQILGLGVIKKIKGTLFEIHPYSIEKKSVENKAYTLIKKQYKRKDYTSTGSERTVIGRMNQRYFKEELMKQYNSKCAMCNFSLKNYLIGAHIVPVDVMRKIDPNNAMNPSNGLLLCRNCDWAYELGDITVDSDYTIKISKKISNQASNSHAIKAWLDNIGEKIYIKKQSAFKPEKKFLKKKISLVRTG